MNDDDNDDYELFFFDMKQKKGIVSSLSETIMHIVNHEFVCTHWIYLDCYYYCGKWLIRKKILF